ncbi:dynein axonemal intermediate chain 4 [Drosophila grimshawi]|uniref:Dynein axonemal intermediate chain 4 n=1 Tax=Drosophila grimshawi TaxID=7222 RepID=B4J1Y2_DROGR|nr:dynein axonemal intermediate chain 4 [Drosophila grimshawi]EDV95907.1 GH15513 [Drosophila grimshawi]
MSRLLNKDYRSADFQQLSQLIKAHPLMKKTTTTEQQQQLQKLRTPEYRTKCVMRASLDDIALGINLYKLHLTAEKSAPKTETISFAAAPQSARQSGKPSATPFIKVLLRKTPIVILFERCSMTAEADTEEGRHVQADNQRYEELLSGTDKTRRTIDADTQTMTALMKSRLMNTERLRTDNVASYVSNFEMFDTYKDLQASTKSVEVQGAQKMEVTTYKVDGIDQFVAINKLPSFRVALMLTMRILASNVFEPQQRRFRNMTPPDPLAEDVKFKYRLRLLWRLSAPSSNFGVQQAVTSVCFCPSNGDILAVSYGIYTCARSARSPSCGYVYVWNIKNPVNPERCYDYGVAVVTVQFSPVVPQLLAIGLHNGDIEVRDISRPDQPPLAISQRSSSPHFEPVTSIKWIPRSDGDVSTGAEITPFLAASQAGAITKYQLINSPHLLGFEHQRFQRAEEELEGIPLQRPSQIVPLLANRHPQCLELVLDPVQTDLYYVLTDEGTLYKCSTNYPLQHLELRQVHETTAVCMDFSPWSPKLYLTCGSDWCIRIWLTGILLPLITLHHHLSPVHCARWSRTHSTILVSLSLNTVDIWDLRNSTLKPVSSTTIDAKIDYTTFCFTHCGRCLAVGNEAGHLLMLAFEDMPFQPHFQYRQLKRALFKALALDPELLEQAKSVGYFGYPGGNSKTNTQ